METFKKYFLWSSIFTVICLMGGFLVWYLWTGNIYAGLSSMFIVVVLWLLESSISFDNAIVNVNVLKSMDKKRQHRFLTRWMLIAVFGMRVLFPLLLVAIFAGISPWWALDLAINNPNQYWEVLKNSHIVIAGFGGAFLMMVGLKFFFNKEKKTHWIERLEKYMTKLWQMEAIEAALVLIILEVLSYRVDPSRSHEFFVAGVWWVVLYILINGIEAFFGHNDNKWIWMVAKTWLTSFIYLEILDASFSLDGVIWAFALSNNLIIIAAWLGIWAFFVRSFTIYMMEQWTLENYKYLEHGAFWAVVALAVMMLAWAIVHLPEVLIWSIWLIFIVWSLYSSHIYNKKQTEK